MSRCFGLSQYWIAATALALLPPSLSGGIQPAFAGNSTLIVTVRDAANSWPIAGATVEAADASATEGGIRTTDAQGRATFGGLSATTFSVTAVTVGFARSSSTVVVGGGTTSATLSLSAFASTLGSVTGAVNVEVGGIGVVALDSATGRPGGRTVTSTNGSFTIHALKAGSYTLVAEGFAAGESTAVLESVTVQSGQTTVLEAEMAVSRSDTGTILGDITFDYTYGTGSPTNNPSEPAAKVVVFASRDGVLYGQATTDSSGHFAIPRLPPGSFVVGNSETYCTAASDEFRDPGVELQLGFVGGVTVASAQETSHDRILERSGALAIEVEDESEDPLDGCEFEIRDAGGSLVAATVIPFGAHYRTWSHLSPGTYSVTVSKSGYASQTASTVVVVSGKHRLVQFTLVAE